MSQIGLLITFVSLASAAALFCFNDKFRKEFFRTAWSLRILVGAPVIVYLGSSALLGSETVKGMLPMVLMMTMQLAFMMFAMIMQWVAMMWIMSRPRIDWYMPGETYDELTWDDYVGNDEIRDRMRLLLDFIQYPEKYRKQGAKLPKGVLLLGPPGVGKTYLARIIANQAGVPIAICESTSLQSPFMAVAALSVKALYRKLRKLSAQYGASMVFFDEIDAIGMSRNRGGGGQMGLGMMGGFMGGGAGGILNALLGCMDGINSNEGFLKKTGRRFGLVGKGAKPAPLTVITVGATNAPIESLDSALVREGRFDWKFHVTTSGDKGRREQIAYFLRNRPHDNTVDVDRLVSDFRGSTPVTIDSVLNNAVIKAVADRRTVINYNDVREALWDKYFGTPEPIDLNELDAERVAYHEAGHGIIDVLYPMHGWACFGATIEPRGKALGMVMSQPNVELHTMTKEDLCRRILVAVASRAVEELRLGIEMNGHSGDLNQATNAAVAMLAQYGMGEHYISFAGLGQPTHPAVVTEAERLLRAHRILARRIVEVEMEAVEALAKALLQHKSIDGREVERIVLAVSQPKLTSISKEVEAIYKELEAADKAKAKAEGGNVLTAGAPVIARPAGEAEKPAGSDDFGSGFQLRQM
jgi:cell division protease FtsH